MKNLLIILVLLSFASCVTQKACSKKFPPQTITVIKDSIRETVIYRDTTVYIKLDGVTITKWGTIYIKNGNVQFTEVKASSNLADARAWIAFNRLNLTVTDKDTLIEVKLLNALKSRDFWRSQFANHKEVITVKETPKFWKVTGWIGIFSVIGLILYIARKFV